MAYDCPGGCPRGTAFSRGDNPFWEIPTGDPNYASNARAIDQTATTVASFRQFVVPAPVTSSNLGIIESGSDFIRLDWSDESSDESGFLLERSLDGSNYEQIASLPANSGTYVDNNLVASTLHYYRVKAWNSSAFSNYSNFATGELSAGGILNGPVYISVRDNERVPHLVTADSVTVNYLMIRNQHQE